MNACVRACACSCVSNKCVYVRLPAGVCICMYASLCAHMCMSAWVRVSMCVSNWQPLVSRGFCMQWTFGATRDALTELSVPGVHSKTLALERASGLGKVPAVKSPGSQCIPPVLGFPSWQAGNLRRLDPRGQWGRPEIRVRLGWILADLCISRCPGVCFLAGAL